MAIDDLLVKLAKLFQKPKLQTVFLINNCDMIIAVLKVSSEYQVRNDPKGEIHEFFAD